MARKPLSKKKLKEAIDGSKGIITIIAQRLDRSRVQVYKYLNRHPDLQREVNEEREKLVDIAEKNLIKKLLNEDTWATGLVLKTLGKSRGYVEGLEVKGDISTKIPTPSELVEAYRKRNKTNNEIHK